MGTELPSSASQKKIEEEDSLPTKEGDKKIQQENSDCSKGMKRSNLIEAQEGTIFTSKVDIDKTDLLILILNDDLSISYHTIYFSAFKMHNSILDEDYQQNNRKKGKKRRRQNDIHLKETN